MELTEEEKNLIADRRKAAAAQKQSDLDAAGVFDMDSIKPNMSAEDRMRAKRAIVAHWGK